MQVMTLQKRLLSTEEARHYIDMGENQFLELVKDHPIIKPIKTGKRALKFDIKDLDAYIESLKKGN
jgi:predicted DNA-binding transcriptional regulator AlpA